MEPSPNIYWDTEKASTDKKKIEIIPCFLSDHHQIKAVILQEHKQQRVYKLMKIEQCCQFILC